MGFLNEEEQYVSSAEERNTLEEEECKQCIKTVRKGEEVVLCDNCEVWHYRCEGVGPHTCNTMAGDEVSLWLCEEDPKGS